LFFFGVRFQCTAETVRGIEENACFKYRDSENDYEFDAGEYLRGSERQEYYKQLITDNNPQLLMFVNQNYCECDFTKFSARKLTSIIATIEQQKHSIEKMKRENA
jgi:hypothetical protein